MRSWCGPRTRGQLRRLWPISRQHPHLLDPRSTSRSASRSRAASIHRLLVSTASLSAATSRASTSASCATSFCRSFRFILMFWWKTFRWSQNCRYMPSGIFSECSSSCIIISQIRSSTVIRGCPKPWLNIVVCAVPFFDIFLTFGNRLRGHISPMPYIWPIT